MSEEVIEANGAGLPPTVGDLQRKSLRSRTINDHVEDVFLRLYDADLEFKAFLDAVGNEDAVEGSLRADDFVAAQMIRTAAFDDSPLKGKNLEAIRKALNIVMRRYGISRSERRNLLDGQIITKQPAIGRAEG